MSKTFVCRSTTLGDSFETNFPSTEGSTWLSGWPKEMTEATAAEVESNMVFPNSTTRAVGFHVEIGKVDWSDDRVGAADWSTIFRTGATGNTSVQLDTVKIQRVSADGNTIRATITAVSGATDAMGADTNIQNDVSADTSLDSPAGAASTDHLAITFVCDNTHSHGGDETTSCEQNTSASTRIVVPIDDPATARTVWAKPRHAAGMI